MCELARGAAPDKQVLLYACAFGGPGRAARARRKQKQVLLYACAFGGGPGPRREIGTAFV